MSLVPGARIGPYEVSGKLGEGGMGEVFRARDTQLSREVAIKVLPDALARDAERLARFRREAQALAALNHPHIAQIYRLEDLDGTLALVMEYVEGRTLAELIAASAGPSRHIDVDDVLRLAAQIAAGLEIAHEKNIVHRDLKPANVKVTPEGQVKILDFGLAKALDADPASSDLMNSPTLTARATEAGMILGTAAYMSPEQARGKPVDKRTDIWAFGAVVFEMLTGRRAFEGETVSDTLASVLRSDPEWTLLGANVPLHAQALLRRCLERDTSKRLRDIGEARLALERRDASVIGSVVTAGPVSGMIAAPRTTPPWIWIAATAVFAAIASYFALTSATGSRGSENATGAPAFELAISAPDGAEFRIGSNSGNVIVSPDGTKIAFVAETPQATTLWVRSLNADDARSISGTEGAFYPFWSPDSRQIAFFANSKLMRVDLAGGLPEVVADASGGRGGTWSEDGTIVFSPVGGSTIFRVAAKGGEVTPVTKFDESRGENAHYWPMFLPGGARFVYFVRSTRVENSGIYLAPLDGSAPPVRLLSSLSSGIPAIRPSTGELQLLWVRDGDLLAQALDADAGALRGDVATVARGVLVLESQRLALASVSRSGVVAWATARAVQTTFGLYRRDGRRVRTLEVPPGAAVQPALSPDGSRLLFVRVEKGGADVYMLDLASGTIQQLTTDPDYDELPMWTAGGKAALYLGRVQGQRSIFRLDLGAGGKPIELARGVQVGMVTPDGRFVLARVDHETQGANVVAFPQFGDRKPVPLAAGPEDESIVGLSRDGRWILLASVAGGRASTSLVRFVVNGDVPSLGAGFPIPEGDRLVSPGSDFDLREFFILARSGEVKSIPVTATGDSVTMGAATAVFRLGRSDQSISASADGTQFVVLEMPFAAGQTLRILTNWESRR